MSKLKKIRVLLTLLPLVHVSSSADDIDLYTDVRPATEPLLFLILDYHQRLGSRLCDDVSSSVCKAKMGEAYDALLTAVPSGDAVLFDGLRAVVSAFLADLRGVKIALAVSHADSCSGQDSGGGPLVTGCSNGGYILHGLDRVDEDDSNGHKQAILNSLYAMPSPGSATSHPFQGKELYFEIFRYLTGGAWHNSMLGWDDYGSDGESNLSEVNSLLARDEVIISGSRYQSPLTDAAALACSRVFAVNILFQGSKHDSDNDAELNDSLANGGLDLGLSDPEFTDVLTWMNDTDLAPVPANGHWPSIAGIQNLRSYFFADRIDTAVDEYAAAGGTVAARKLDTPGMLLTDLRGLFTEVNSMTTTLVAPAVPVNASARSQIEDNVFLALFAVDADGRPSWNGNLKKLKLRTLGQPDSDTVELVDANNSPAISADGQIAHSALTFWTDGASLEAPAGLEVAGRDGRSVTRGGAGQKMPGYLLSSGSIIGDNNTFNSRTVYTENGAALINLGTMNAGLLQKNLETRTPAESEKLVRWIRGQDVDDLDADGDTTEARSWFLGPPLHSRPLPISYGVRTNAHSEDNPDVRIFMGTDDGFMHSFRNTDANTGNESGVEDWAFMPRSVMSKMQILRRNSPLDQHPYTVDGAPSAYVLDVDGDGTIGRDLDGNLTAADRVYVFFGLRRGGRAYYALDVTDPDNPRLAWKIEKTGDFSELGQSWSSPRVGTVRFGTGNTPAIFFGGGYDPDKDDASANDDEGNAIYVVHAETGKLIWKATHGDVSGSVSAIEYHHRGMVDSIASTLSAVDTNADGNIDRLYVGDTGGTVWRVDLPESNTDQRASTWFVTELANLGEDDTSPGTGNNDRRFFHRPDFVASADDAGAFDGVLIGSGDRSDPRGSDDLDYFYLLKDRNVRSGEVSGEPFNHGDFDGDTNMSGLADITEDCISADDCGVDLVNGWKLRMEAEGEKVLAPALTTFGTVFFTSYTPEVRGGQSESNCQPGMGTGRLYAVRLSDGAAAMNSEDGREAHTPTGKPDRYTLLSGGGIPAGVVPLGDHILAPDLDSEPLNGPTFWKIFWYEKNVDGF